MQNYPNVLSFKQIEGKVTLPGFELLVHEEKYFRSLSSVCCCCCCYGGCCFVAVVSFFPKNLWWVTSLDCLAICNNYVEFPTMWVFSPYRVLFSHVSEENMTSSVQIEQFQLNLNGYIHYISLFTSVGLLHVSIVILPVVPYSVLMTF